MRAHRRFLEVKMNSRTDYRSDEHHLNTPNSAIERSQSRIPTLPHILTAPHSQFLRPLLLYLTFLPSLPGLNTVSTFSWRHIPPLIARRQLRLTLTFLLASTSIILSIFAETIPLKAAAAFFALSALFLTFWLCVICILPDELLLIG